VDPDRSFERLYRRHRREVYGTVLRDVRDPDEAEDVTQVAFLNAFRAMRRGDRPEKPRAWLITIARNVVRRRAHLRAERPQEVELDTELLVSLDDMEGSAADDIHASLRRLTDAQREAILLREIQGMSYAEVAEALALSVPAVEALLFRARRALAEELALVERAPVVRRRSQGLLALPGLSKLGSFGFSFGRASVACLVGCVVVAAVPVGHLDAAGEHPRPAAAAHVRAPAPAQRTAPASVTGNAPRKQPAKDRPHGSKHTGSTSNETSGGTPSGGSGSVTVELPPISLPSVQVPVPVPQLPPVEGQPPPAPELPSVPPLPSLTS
jgi:RNA polymerase sigma-70 factor (ECF subfamily)